MKHNALYLPLVVATLAASSLALAAPDFSGNWRLDNDKGRNLGMMKAVTESVAIRQTSERLTADFTSTFMAQTTQRQVVYDLTGRTMPNESAMGEKAETVARWDGNKLVVTWTSEGAIAGSRVVKTESRTLSADGRTMTVVSERPNKEPMEMVYEKN